MRQIKWMGIIVVVIGAFFGFKTEQVQACVNWCDPVCYSDNEDGSCAGWATACCDGGGPLTGQLCGSGQYSCNQADGCCDVGDGGCECGVNSSGTCKACGGTCYQPQYWDVNCPVGTVRGTTVLSSVCPGQSTYCNAGSAQQSTNTCCATRTIQGECGDWYDCGYKASGEVKWCRDCTPDETFCTAWNLETYDCVPICDAPTAPALTSPGNGAQRASTAATLTWSAATFDPDCSKSYEVYIDTANPPTTKYATVDSAITSSAFTGVRGNTYYWYVKAVGGGTLGTNSSIRSFTILDNQITGTVFYDPNNNCGVTQF